MIRVYNGYGTSAIAPRILIERFNQHRYDACGITAGDIKQGLNTQTTKILAFGGQSVTQFKQALGDKGLSEIKNYVANGGHYLGICAGGYFGATQINFQGQHPDGTPYTKSANGLGFFNGLAQGSITDIAQPYSGKTDSAVVIDVTTAQDQISYKTLIGVDHNLYPMKTKAIFGY